MFSPSILSLTLSGEVLWFLALRLNFKNRLHIFILRNSFFLLFLFLFFGPVYFTNAPSILCGELIIGILSFLFSLPCFNLFWVHSCRLSWPHSAVRAFLGTWWRHCPFVFKSKEDGLHIPAWAQSLLVGELSCGRVKEVGSNSLRNVQISVFCRTFFWELIFSRRLLAICCLCMG